VVRAAEAAAGEVVLRVHPTQEAERRRQDVISYLRRLIGSSLGCEVRAYPPLRSLSISLPEGAVYFLASASASSLASPCRPPLTRPPARVVVFSFGRERREGV